MWFSRSRFSNQILDFADVDFAFLDHTTCFLKRNRISLKKKVLKKGDAFHFPPGSIHQELAITNCTIVEASTPHFNDRVRVEKRYGIEEPKGLKTTKISDIKFI